MQNPNAATSGPTGQFPFNISIPDTRRLREAVQKRDAGEMDQAMFDHIVGELSERYDQEKIQEAIDRFRVEIDGSITRQFLKSVLTSKQLRALPIPDKPPTVGDWFKTGDIGYVFASRGTGKTWFSMELANAISAGRNFGPWEVTEAQKVLYIDGEVNFKDTQKRTFALNIDNDNLIYLHHEQLYQTTHLTIDIANEEQQEAFLEVCQELGVEVVVLDNLSCLAPKVDENDSFGFSNELLNFTLNMRRNGISLVFVQHAGRNGQMRGHSRREDAANWIIRLDESRDADDIAGAKFLSVFVKNRNAQKIPSTYEWHFLPDGERTLATFKEMEPLSLFRTLVESGVVQNKELAEAMGLKPFQITRLATKAMKQGWLTKKGQSYVLTGSKQDELEKKDLSWIYHGDTICTVTENGNETRVTCSVSGEEVNGKTETKKRAGSTIARGLTLLNKSCSCGGKHYVEEVDQ